MKQHGALGIARWLIVVALLGRPAMSSAQQTSAQAAETEEQARGHFRLGRAYYDNGAFSQAATEFEAAYRISQRPALLYNIYLAYRDANDTRHAADALRKYLELEKNVENRAQLNARLAALDHTLAEQEREAAAERAAATSASVPAQPPSAMVVPSAGATPRDVAATEVPKPQAPSPEPSEPLPLPAADTRAQSETSSSLRPLPIALLAVGGAMVVGSVITGVLALGKRSDLADAEHECKLAQSCDALSVTRLKQLEDTRSSGKTLAIVTDVLLFGGIAAAATGTVLLLLGRSRESDTSAALTCYPGQCSGHLKLRF